MPRLRAVCAPRVRDKMATEIVVERLLMTTKTEYEQLMRLMADFASGYLKPAIEVRNTGKKLETDGDFSAIFYGFTEIGEALDALALVEQLLRLAPPRSNRIDKDSYLKFLVGSYLQEMYILEQRLTAYAKKLSRLYNKPLLPSLVHRVVYKPLEGIISTRGAHVHQSRFTDKNLDSVSTMALFKRAGHVLGEDLEVEYKLAQWDWSKRVKENNQKTREIINSYSKIIKVVICNNGVISFPSGNK